MYYLHMKKRWDWEKKEVNKVLLSSNETEFQEDQQDQEPRVLIDTQFEDENEEDSFYRPRKFQSLNEIMQQTQEMAQAHKVRQTMSEDLQKIEEAVKSYDTSLESKRNAMKEEC